jgi:O-antigen/teichoic acid export membrane protein
LNTAGTEIDPVPADGSHAERRAARGRRLKLSILTSLLTKPLAVVIPAVTVPLFLRYLGDERYGLYESIGALAAWIALTDAGLGLGLVNRLTDCHVTGDAPLARRYVSSFFVAILTLVALAAIVLTIAVPLIDWSAVFPRSGELARRQTPWAVWAAGMLVLLGLAASYPAAIYTAHQELHRYNLWDGAGKVATLLAGIAVVFTPFGLVGVMVAATGAAVAVRLLNTAYLFAREKPWLRPDPRLFDPTLLKATLTEAFGLFVISAAAMTLFQTDKLIIGVVLGPAEVTDYAVVGRVFMTTFGLWALLIAPLWPAYGEAVRRGDLHWVRWALVRSLLVGCGGILFTGLVMYFFGEQVVRIWTRGQPVNISRPLVVALTATFMLWTWVGFQSIALNAAGVLRPQMLVIGAHAALNLAIAVPAARWYGPVGVAWANFLTGLATTAWGHPWLIRRYILSAPPRTDAPTSTLAPAAPPQPPPAA